MGDNAEKSEINGLYAYLMGDNEKAKNVWKFKRIWIR